MRDASARSKFYVHSSSVLSFLLDLSFFSYSPGTTHTTGSYDVKEKANERGTISRNSREKKGFPAEDS